MKKENFICIDLFKRIKSKTSHKTKRNLSLLSNKQQKSHLRYRNTTYPHHLNKTQRQFYKEQILETFDRGRNKRKQCGLVVGRRHNQQDDFEDLKGWSITQQQNASNSNGNQIIFNIKRRQDPQQIKKSVLHINTTPHLDSKPLMIHRKHNIGQVATSNDSEKVINRLPFSSRNNRIYSKENHHYGDKTLRFMNRQRMVHNLSHLTKFQNWIKNHLRLDGH